MGAQRPSPTSRLRGLRCRQPAARSCHPRERGTQPPDTGRMPSSLQEQGSALGGCPGQPAARGRRPSATGVSVDEET
jgi:hypothetical protein